MSDVKPLQLNVPLPLWGRLVSLAEDAGMGAGEYVALLLVEHAKARHVTTVGVHLSREQVEDRIVAAALGGRTTRAIAQELGMTNQAVNDIRRRRGVGTNQIGGPRAA